MLATALAAFPADYDAFKGALIQQETGGRYGISNTQGSGAVGLGQVMPGTAKALAGRLGVSFRPDLLSGTDAESRKYQDLITDAAVREAWNAGGQGKDLRTAAMYYHGGSNRKVWGPKTRKYAEDIIGRLR